MLQLAYSLSCGAMAVLVGFVVVQASTVVVLFDSEHNQQRFFLGHDDDVMALARHPTLDICASGQAGPRPSKVCVYDASAKRVEPLQSFVPSPTARGEQHQRRPWPAAMGHGMTCGRYLPVCCQACRAWTSARTASCWWWWRTRTRTRRCRSGTGGRPTSSPSCTPRSAAAASSQLAPWRLSGPGTGRERPPDC